MSDLGGITNLPFDLGGEPSPELKTYTTLKRMVGEGVSPPGDDFGDATLMGSWRMAKAHGLVAISSFAEAALCQGFPNTVSDELESYEEVLLLFPPPETPDQSRRQAITDRWTRTIESSIQRLGPQLLAIDPRLSFTTVPDSAVRYVQLGRYYDDLTDLGGSFKNGRKHSSFPNFADFFVARVIFDIGNVPVIDEIAQVRAEASDLLDESLPAWCDFSISHVTGFTLDLSMLDAASFDS
jgi:hypothetical protein